MTLQAHADIVETIMGAFVEERYILYTTMLANITHRAAASEAPAAGQPPPSTGASVNIPSPTQWVCIITLTSTIPAVRHTALQEVMNYLRLFSAKSYSHLLYLVSI